MANMDDYYRATLQAKEANDCNHDEQDHEADSDELTGTRNDVEADLDSFICEDLPSATTRVDDFVGRFDDGAASNTYNSSVPVFPTLKSGSTASSTMYPALLVASAQNTVDTSIQLSHQQIVDIPVNELQQWVKDPATNDEESLTTEQPANERPADVIELIQRALESDSEWLPSIQQHDRPPLCPYSTIGNVSRAFTLNRRQHVAFSIIAAALLHRFKQQELANTHGLA